MRLKLGEQLESLVDRPVQVQQMAGGVYILARGIDERALPEQGIASYEVITAVGNDCFVTVCHEAKSGKEVAGRVVYPTARLLSITT